MKSLPYQQELNQLHAIINDMKRDHHIELVNMRKDLDRTQVELVKVMNLLQELETPIDRLSRTLKLYNGSDKNVQD